MNPFRYCLPLVLFLLAAVSRAALAQSLISEEPHDLITIPDGKETKTISVYPVKLPNRRIPTDAKPTDKLRIRLLDDEESRDFDLFWRDVKKLELWENRVLAEAEAFTSEGKLDQAYADFAYLFEKYPNTERLDEAIQSYWYQSVGASFREKRYDEALAVLELLLQKNPSFKYSEASPTPINVLGRVCDKLLQGYLANQDFRTASQLINRIAAKYPESKQEPFYSSFREGMEKAAEAKRDLAREHLTARRFTEAYDATAAMLDIWPEVTGGRELAIEMSETYPLAAVAVEQLSVPTNNLNIPARLDRWADQRVARLVDRRLTEIRGIGPEGGNYVCPLGECERSDDGRTLSLSLTPEGPFSSFNVVQLLVEGATPNAPSFSPAWAQVLGAARVVRPGQVEATLRRPHVLPQALLDFSLSVNPQSQQWSGTYQVAAGNETLSRYVQPPESGLVKGKPREIQERVYASPEAALLALQRGEVDALDRIQPADLATVRNIPSVRVMRYAVPTLHVLVPNPDRPWPANRTFRRAVMYGIQREAILKQGILQGQEVPGAQLISGPFPAPGNLSDPLSYAYDATIEPHAYEPLLTVTLVELAKREVEAAARIKNENPPPYGSITLGHGPAALHRIACNAMMKQLAPLGVKCTLQEITDPASAENCDFVYAELVVTEPVIDAERMFGAGGLYPASNSYVRLGVRSVAQATTWNQAGQRLRQLHRVLHEDLTVLPLWQTPEHFALRSNVQGVSAAPVSLYQDIDSWRVAPRLGQK